MAQRHAQPRSESGSAHRRPPCRRACCPRRSWHRMQAVPLHPRTPHPVLGRAQRGKGTTTTEVSRVHCTGRRCRRAPSPRQVHFTAKKKRKQAGTAAEWRVAWTIVCTTHQSCTACSHSRRRPTATATRTCIHHRHGHPCPYIPLWVFPATHTTSHTHNRVAIRGFTVWTTRSNRPRSRTAVQAQTPHPLRLRRQQQRRVDGAAVCPAAQSATAAPSPRHSTIRTHSLHSKTPRRTWSS